MWKAGPGAARGRAGKGPITPDGELTEEKYRLVVEGPPNWTSFRDFWKMFYDEGAVVVASTYAKVGGVYDFGFRHERFENRRIVQKCVRAERLDMKLNR